MIRLDLVRGSVAEQDTVSYRFLYAFGVAVFEVDQFDPQGVEVNEAEDVALPDPLIAFNRESEGGNQNCATPPVLVSPLPMRLESPDFFARLMVREWKANPAIFFSSDFWS